MDILHRSFLPLGVLSTRLLTFPQQAQDPINKPMEDPMPVICAFSQRFYPLVINDFGAMSDDFPVESTNNLIN